MTTRTTMRPARGDTLELSVSATSARTAALQASDVGFYCATAAFIKFGDDTVTAATDDYDIYVPAGVVRDLFTGGATNMAVILASGTDTAYINEWVTSTI